MNKQKEAKLISWVVEHCPTKEDAIIALVHCGFTKNEATLLVEA